MKTIHKWHGIEPIQIGDKSLAKAALHVLLINTELDVGLGYMLTNAWQMHKRQICGSSVYRSRKCKRIQER